MASRFRLCIVDTDTNTLAASFAPGAPVECDLVESVIARLSQERVGYFTSTAAVEQAVRRAWSSALLDLKRQVRP